MDHGVKFVEAETMMGAIFGLGFIHAKDRLWQMHFYKHLVQGRLAELVGHGGIEIDKYVRTIGLPRAARMTWDQLSLDNRALLQNYANGVNKVGQNIALYPVEFDITWTNFEPWTPQDSLAM